MFEGQPQTEVEALMHNPEFKQLYQRHKQLDKQVLDAELGVLAVDDVTLSQMKRDRVDGLFVFPNFINGKHAQLILDFASTNRLPTMFQETWCVEKGGLMSYYTN